MSTKFFTNNQENTLLEKFKGIFKYSDVSFFDVLVGYFYSSGYFRIRKYLKDVKEIRILVGIGIDNLIRNAKQQSIEFHFNSAETKKEYIKELERDIQKADYKKDIEEGILQFIEDVNTGKIKIKAHPAKNIHAKIYIFRPADFNSHTQASVITGSSNLTKAGLETNFEFNVELRDYDDVKFASETFEKLWKEGEPIEKELIRKIKKETYLNDEFTPFEIYIKFLIEYFDKSIEYDPDSITDLPKGYSKLKYQIDAVNEGFNKLSEHNGFILADVVGLGKTVIAVMIAKKFLFTNGVKTKILIVHPPALYQNWEQTIHDFHLPNVDYITNGSLHKVKHPEDYDLIIVDEAHKFRSDESERFAQLQKLCKTPRRREGYDGTLQKKVILISATPLNNRPEDIRNQLYLFQDARNSTLPIINIQNFFRPLIDKYKMLHKKKDNKEIAVEVKGIYEKIRTKILEPLIVRRTRTDILNTEEYIKDMSAQGIKFPDIEPPRKILYQLDDELNELYDYTLKLLKDTNTGIKYYRYQAIKFLKEEFRKQYPKAVMISEQLAAIMKTLLVKRIDSSFYAFKKSLGRFSEANKAMIKMFENGRIYIAPDININEFILNENEDDLIKLLEEKPDKIQQFKPEDFFDYYLPVLKEDQAYLEELTEKWDKITYDPKINEFLNKLENELFDEKINKNQKLVVFSESKETTEYVSKHLKKNTKFSVLPVDSSNVKDLFEIIKMNFDANIPANKKRNDFDIIITTEVLAEGINLHGSNIIVNYDIPWNATRLMQRIGRVNRIGTDADKIYIYNFFPTVKTDDEIELNKKAYIKLQSFHSALGEDSQIYSTDEEFESFGLFENLPKEDTDERLEYLSFIRKFKDQNPEEFKKIKNMPLRARTGRKDKTKKEASICYLKNKRRDSFFYVNKDNSIEELSFVEAAEIFNALASERPYKLHENHHNQINTALKTFNDEISLIALGDKKTVKLGPNEANAIALLNDNARSEFADKNEKELLKTAILAIKRGRFQKLQREINKLRRQIPKEKMKRLTIFEKIIEIVKQYPLTEEISENEKSRNKNLSDLNPEIIISESFDI